jgi:hypothetical protein
MKRTAIRWIPAVLAPVLVAATAIGLSGSATASVDLPDKTASQILQFINTNPDIAFSGKVVKVADLISRNRWLIRWRRMHLKR